MGSLLPAGCGGEVVGASGWGGMALTVLCPGNLPPALLRRPFSGVFAVSA